MAKRIYFRSMGETMGPVTGEQLREQAVQGIITPDTLVRVGDDGEWVRASRLTNLFDDEGKGIGPKSTTSTTSPRNKDNPQKATNLTRTQTRIMLLFAGCLVLLLSLVWFVFFVF